MMEPMNDIEIRLNFQRLDDSFQSQNLTLGRMEKTLEGVDAKVAYTNGKVGEVVKWQERARGAGWAIGSVFVLVIVPLAGWVLYNQAQETRHINTAISAYLKDNYTITKNNAQ